MKFLNNVYFISDSAVPRSNGDEKLVPCDAETVRAEKVVLIEDARVSNLFRLQWLEDGVERQRIFENENDVQFHAIKTECRLQINAVKHECARIDRYISRPPVGYRKATSSQELKIAA